MKTLLLTIAVACAACGTSLGQGALAPLPPPMPHAPSAIAAQPPPAAPTTTASTPRAIRPETPDDPIRSAAPIVPIGPPLTIGAPETWKLANGVKVILLADPSALTVSVRAFVATRAFSGPLTLAVESATCGSKSFPTPNQLMGEYRRSAAAFHWTTTRNGFELMFSAPFVEPAPAFRALVETVSAPVFDAACVDRVIAHRRMGLLLAETQPLSIVRQVATRVANERSPSASAYLTEAELDILSRGDLANVYATSAQPHRLTVIVAGRITRAAVDEALRPLGEPWPIAADALAILKRAPPPSRNARAGREPAPAVAIGNDRETIARVHLQYDIPAVSDGFALRVAWQIVGASIDSRIRRQFRNVRGPGWDLGTWLMNDGPRERVFFELTVPNDELDAALGSLERELRNFAAEGPSEGEVAAAKRGILTSLATTLESPEDLSNVLESTIARGLPIDAFTSPTRRYDAVTLADTRRAARTLDPSAALVVIIGDRPLAARAMANAFHRTAQLRDAAGNPIPESH